MQLQKLLLLRQFILFKVDHLLEAVILDLVIFEFVLLLLQVLVIHLRQSISRHVFSTEEERILSSPLVELVEWLFFERPLWVKTIGVPLGELWSSVPSDFGDPCVLNANGHGAIEPNIFEVIFSTAALGPLGWVDQAVQLNISSRLIFDRLEVVLLVLVQGQLVELS